jgi:hypothetical protein
MPRELTGPYSGPVVPAPRLQALAAELEEHAERLERRGAPDLETGRHWDRQAANARIEAARLRRRAAAPRLHAQLMRLRGWPSPAVTIRATPRAREARPAQNRRTAVSTRAGPDDGSGSPEGDEPPSELDALPGSRSASNRMVVHVGRRLGSRKAA